MVFWIRENLSAFLGHRFEIIDSIYSDNKAAVQYRSSKDGREMKVAEWYYFRNNLIAKIVAYYNIEEREVLEY